MLALKKITHGLSLIRQAIQLLIAHPVLLVYGSVIVLNVFFALTRSSTVPVYNIISILLLLLVNFFALACLCHHTMHILQQELHGVRDTIVDVTKKSAKLLIWFGMQFILKFFGSLSMGVLLEKNNLGIHSYSMLALAMLFMLGFAVITFYIALVLVILATEPTGIVTAIQRSCRLVATYCQVFLGIFLVFFLSDVLSFWLFPSLMMVIEYIRYVTYTIFYYEYYARSRPDLASMYAQDI